MNDTIRYSGFKLGLNTGVYSRKFETQSRTSRHRLLQTVVARYKRAAELAQSESAPLSNLSAAYFELGLYTSCRETCQAALKLLNSGDDISAQKLHLRSLKASLLLKDIDHARDSLASLDLNEERHRLEQCLSLIEGNHDGGLDVEMRIISDLPITKPQL